MSRGLENNRIWGLLLEDLKRLAGKWPAGKNPKLENFEKEFGLGSASKKKVRVGSGSGYSSDPEYELQDMNLTDLEEDQNISLNINCEECTAIKFTKTKADWWPTFFANLSEKEKKKILPSLGLEAPAITSKKTCQQNLETIFNPQFQQWSKKIIKELLRRFPISNLDT